MKRIILTLILVFYSILGFTQKKEFQLSTHILDITEGMPARDITVKLEKMNNNGTWNFISEKITDNHGRVNEFLPPIIDNTGIYRLKFMVNDYFKSKNKETFYPFIEVVFQIKDEKHYHVPITLSAFGYSTYRGS